ncbi:MAG: hypothetical protein ACKO26_11525 [Planctomycetota bacterium]
MPVRFRCGHCRQLMAISKRKIGTMVPCPTCQTMIEVPKDDMATVDGGAGKLRKEGTGARSGQPLLEEDFDQVISSADLVDQEDAVQQIDSSLKYILSKPMLVAIIAISAIMIFLIGLACGILIAKIWFIQQA